MHVFVEVQIRSQCYAKIFDVFNGGDLTSLDEVAGVDRSELDHSTLAYLDHHIVVQAPLQNLVNGTLNLLGFSSLKELRSSRPLSACRNYHRGGEEKRGVLVARSNEWGMRCRMF